MLEGDAEKHALVAAEMPPADARELAMRFNPGLGEIPEVVNDTQPSHAVGDTDQFWISNSDTEEHTQITAELRYLNDVVAMWVEEGVKMDLDDLMASADRFAEETYGTNREFFGSEWSPGVDNDPVLHILHARNLGASIAGYYSSADEYAEPVNKYSNQREMFYISADPGNAGPNDAFYDGTLAHEFQHMIHWANDRNEHSWVNEGLSELASYLNEFDPGGADMAYAQEPDTQLTTWADPSEGNIEHYGASYLFMSYFLDRFGEETTKALVASPRNGIASVDDALEKSGRSERFDEVFADWVLANYLDRPNGDDVGRYGYEEIDPYPMAVSQTHRRYPTEVTAEVSQYGADYIRLRGSQPLQIAFSGQTQNRLVNAVPDGNAAWWSNRGDQSDATLTRAVDLRDVPAATLTFAAWYDIEDGWDYGYITVSTDGGETWEILRGAQTTDENPVGNAFGPGWTGISGSGDSPEWVEERVDLTRFAGKEILLRFEYVTDDAVNRPGLLIDRIAIPEIGYADGAEAGMAGWDARGWILTDNKVDQPWLVQLIEIDQGLITVKRLELNATGQGMLETSDLGDLEEAVLVISGLAPLTTEPATYGYTITPVE
jgi:hypothetical protein